MVNYITSCYIQSYFDRLDPLNLRKRNKGIPCTKIECEKMYRGGLKDMVVNDEPMNLKDEKIRDAPLNSGVTPHTQAIRRLHADILKATSLLKEFPCLQKIPWNICMFDRGEFPYPHTHGDTVFLHASMFASYNAYPDAFYSVLIHEKIHIFQRLYPLETYAYIRNVLGCDIANKRDPDSDPDESTTESAESMSTRMNPDTNALTYCIMSRKREDSEIRALWKTVNGDSAEIVDMRDHPFEMMAYSLTDTLLGRRNKYGGKMTNGKDEETWIKTYLEE